MNPSTRVVLNTFVTYVRFVAGLMFGLFSSRWILAALGQTDYGIYGVVGSVIAVATFLNTVLATSVSRFYSVTIGEAGEDALPKEDNAELRGWFNAALALHAGIAVIVLAVGWPLGEWALQHWLTIPADRLGASLWVLRAGLVAAALSVASVPYSGMFTAWQRFGELAAFELLRSGATFAVAASILSASGDRLVVFAFLLAGLSCAISLLQIVRARFRFGACRIECGTLPQIARMRELVSYAGWRVLGIFGWLVQKQGGAFAVNVSFGTKANAAFAIANQVVTHASSLMNALAAALVPALATEMGKGGGAAVKPFALKSCKFTGILAAVCAVPLLCEMDYILRLWLHFPPNGSGALASAFIVAMVVDSSTTGIVAALSATRNIGPWQTFECLVLVGTCPAALICFRQGRSIAAIGVVFIVASAMIVVGRVWFARRMMELRAGEWLVRALLPIVAVVLLSAMSAWAIRASLSPSLLRFGLVVFGSLLVTFLAAFMIAMNGQERNAAWQIITRGWRVHGCR